MLLCALFAAYLLVLLSVILYNIVICKHFVTFHLKSHLKTKVFEVKIEYSTFVTLMGF